MFRLVFLLLVLIDGKRALRCKELKDIGFLDCSELGISRINQLKSLKWVKSLDLSSNHIISINPTELLTTFPNLQFLNIQNNPNFDCLLVKEKRCVVASNCKLELSTWTSMTSTAHISSASTVSSTAHILPSSMTSTAHISSASTVSSTAHNLSPSTASTAHNSSRSTVSSTAHISSASITSTAHNLSSSTASTAHISSGSTAYTAHILSLSTTSYTTYIVPQSPKDSRLLFLFLDCSELGISRINQLKSLKWVKSLDLSSNHIISINPTELLTTFPNLQFLNIQNNPNFDCLLVKEKRFVVASDCKLESSTWSSMTSTAHISSTRTVSSTAHILSSSMTSTTHISSASTVSFTAHISSVSITSTAHNLSASITSTAHILSSSTASTAHISSWSTASIAHILSSTFDYCQ